MSESLIHAVENQECVIFVHISSAYTCILE